MLIPNHRMSGYQKFCYWLNQKKLDNLSGSLKREELPLVEETRIPCRVLRASSEIGLVPPPAWKGFCKRRTSWYWTSEKAGKLLVVSKRPLHISGPPKVIRIIESNFYPERAPTLDEIEALANSPAFQRRKPGIWDKIDSGEKDSYQRWFERFGGNGPFDFDEIFMFHSANHANFLDAKFFVSLENGAAPYSIAKSSHICSSCLEFFSILGDQWPLKYVTPCMGAVEFAHLSQDQYFCVVTEEKASKAYQKDPCQDKANTLAGPRK